MAESTIPTPWGNLAAEAVGNKFYLKVLVEDAGSAVELPDPLIETIDAAGESGTFVPPAGRDFNITIVAPESAVVTVKRIFGFSLGEGSSAPVVVVTDAMRKALPPSFAWSEAEADVAYFVDVETLAAGEVSVRISA